ncbi:MAG: lysylphosphatidylglycerol synthase transmembrane domain-containing protein, partial [Actinomycetota bacterium]
MTRNRRWWLQAGLLPVVLVAAFGVALPRFAGYDEVWSVAKDLDPKWLPALLVLGAINLVAPSLSFRAALDGLRLRDAVVMDWATTLVTNLIPGGSALAVGLTWSMLRSFGLATGAIARAIAVTGVWDLLIKLGVPLLAVLLLAATAEVTAGLVAAATFGAVLFVAAVVFGRAMLSGGATAAAVGRFIDRLRFAGQGWPARLDDLRQETAKMVGDRWRALTWWTAFGHANLFVLLVVCLRAVGADGSRLGLASILAAFAFGRLITAVPLTPGGLGVLEVGLVGALGAAGTAPEAQLVAGVLLFRF